MPTRERRLRELVLLRLKKAGFRGTTSDSLAVRQDKNAFRRVHRLARRHEVDVRRDRVRSAWQRHKVAFANGLDVDPPSIAPRLEIVELDDDWNNELFRLARLYWSLPYSQGYGRRLRALIWDDSTGKLIGILGLQSPPLDFEARDQRFCYPQNEKTWFVNQMMDAYTVGAVPPYSFLLGGKLAAMALASNEIREAYRNRYAEQETRMEGRVIPPRLVAITTTSAYGKSALYDRIKDDDGAPLLESLGTIEATHGSYHFNGVYPLLRDFLVDKHKRKSIHGFGVGPRIRWQILREGLREIGLSPNLLQHRVPREVFLVSNLKNLEQYVSGVHRRPLWHDRPFHELSKSWQNRWLLPRWDRTVQDDTMLFRFLEWNRSKIIAGILNA